MVRRGLNLGREERRYLETGKVISTRESDIVGACDRYIRDYAHKNLAGAISLARQLVGRARPLHNELSAIALRTLGWVLLVGADFRNAEAAYLEARTLSSKDPTARARIDRILIDIYMHLGNIPEARRRARNAIRTFRRLGDADGEAKTQVNYANSYHRQDRHADALRMYRKAIAYYAGGDDKLTLGACYHNCANSLVQLLQFDEAERFYRQAEEVFEELGYDLYVTEARYGRAWLEKLRGNYHLSLRALSRCEDHFRSVGQPRGVTLCQLDRAEVMLELQLLDDARALARQAEKDARRLNLGYEAAKASLFLAKAAFGLGAGAEARRALKRANEGFRRVANPGMLAVTRFYEALHLKGASAKREFAAVQRLFRKAQLPLWQAVCDLTLAAVAGKGNGELHIKRLKSNRAIHTVPHLYANWQTLVGDRALDRNDIVEAKRSWERAADTLDQMRANLPPVDVRQSLAAHDLDPYRRMFGGELQSDPESAALWSERGKVSGVWARPDQSVMPEARLRVSRGLSQLARQVTALSVSLERTRGEATGEPWPSSAPYRRLQSQVRRNLLTLARAPQPSESIQEELHRMLRGSSATHPLVQFHSDGRRLYGFVHHRGDTRVHVYPQGVAEVTRFLGQWSLLLGETLARGRKVRRVDRDEERRLLQQLGDWLWSPLELTPDHQRISIIPAGHMAGLPWSAIIDKGAPLIEHHRLALAPSIRHYALSAEKGSASRAVRIMVGNTTGLRHTPEEISMVSRLEDTQVSVLDPCRREDWPESDEALLWHYVGHAQYRGDNPFYSSLTLADGPLFAADFRLRNCRVGLVTLAACRTGVQSSVPTYESTGMVRSLLEMGAHNVVASHWEVGDRATAEWMRAFYIQVGRGRSLTEAIQTATLEMRGNFPCASQWAAFSLFGSGRGFHEGARKCI
jgi:tetratricopeptide (TPR) repeat protein